MNWTVPNRNPMFRIGKVILRHEVFQNKVSASKRNFVPH